MTRMKQSHAEILKLLRGGHYLSQNSRSYSGVYDIRPILGKNRYAITKQVRSSTVREMFHLGLLTRDKDNNIQPASETH